jgi:hypothetical protein
MIGAVKNYLFWLCKHILVNPRFTVACDTFDITMSQVNTSSFEPDLGKSKAVEGSSTLSNWHELPSLPWPDGVLYPLL